MVVERDLYKEIVPYLNSSEAIVITGMRRTGKTTLLQYIYNKIPSANKLMLDLENPLYQKFFEEEDFEQIKHTLEIQGVTFSKPAYIFLDEIQFVKNLPQVVKYLADHYQIKFFLTGSSSFYLKNLFSESLAGRKYIFELYPLSFREFLLFKESDLQTPVGRKAVSSKIFQLFAPLYDEYLRFGGFPGVVNKESYAEKKKALDDIFSSYFQLEVVQLGDFRKTDSIRDLIILLTQRVGSKVDITKLASELGVTRPTVYEYLAFLQGTYFIHLVKPFGKNKDVEIRGTEKVFFCDSGLLNNTTQITEGALFENNIYQQLVAKGKVNYFQTKSGAEIDFVVDSERAYEVKLSPSVKDYKTVAKLSEELSLSRYALVSNKYKDIANTVYGFNIL